LIREKNMRLPMLLLVALLAFTAPASAALPACANETERQAMAVRALQSYFMVAGVACNQAAAYNKFITKYQSPVSAYGSALKSYFTRVYSGSAERQLNDFITGLANAWSQVHMQDMGTYCKGTWEAMWQLDKEPSADPAKLVQYARSVSVQPAVTSVMCAGATTSTQLAQR
jgi:hypothetical protein